MKVWQLYYKSDFVTTYLDRFDCIAHILDGGFTDHRIIEKATEGHAYYYGEYFFKQVEIGGFYD